MNLYMFRAVPLPIIRSSLTGKLTLVFVILFEVSLRAGSGPVRKLTSNSMTNTSVKFTVNELLMMGRGTARNM